MSTPAIPRQIGRELLKLSRRPRHPSALIRSFERPLPLSQSPTATAARSFGVQSAFRNVADKTSKSVPNFSNGSQQYARMPMWAAGGGAIALLFALLQPFNKTAAAEPAIEILPAKPEDPTPVKIDHSDGLPRYRLSEVQEHGPKSERPWVIYGDKVYDITDWIPAHPGGEVILRAAGSSIEPYWNIFAIHKTQYVLDILEQYVVGRIHPDDLVDGKVRLDKVPDPFLTDPERDERMRFITSKPCNAETPGAELANAFLTPNEVFYVRNHMWVPVVEEKEADEHGISVELPNGDIRTYTIAELKARFKQHTVTSAMQCSGNRRKDMTDHAKKTNGLQWTVGAISCAKWEGVRLRDVLADAGLSLADPGEDAQHVQFTGLEAYGASIPITSAVDPRGDVLLAFRMNDQVLPRDHGFPVRVVVPGHVAARAVKWVNKIVVSDEESTTSWQRKDYKCFGPNEVKQDWDKYKSIQEMPITSAITRTRLRPLPTTITTEKQNQQQQQQQPLQQYDANSSKAGSPGQTVEVEGYAYSGGGREIQRVDISLDGGKTWDQAQLLDDRDQEHGSKAWAWKRWKYVGKLPEVVAATTTTAQQQLASTTNNGTSDQQQQQVQKNNTAATTTATTTFVVKATDDAYNTQPETHRSIYNLRGNLATAWHRVEFDCRGSSSRPCADEVVQQQKKMAQAQRG